VDEEVACEEAEDVGAGGGGGEAREEVSQLVRGCGVLLEGGKGGPVYGWDAEDGGQGDDFDVEAGIVLSVGLGCPLELLVGVV